MELILLSITNTSNKVEQLTLSELAFNKLVNRLYLGQGVLTSFRLAQTGDKIYLPFCSDHRNRICHSLKLLFPQVNLESVEIGFNYILNLLLGNHREPNFKAFTLLSFYLKESDEIIFVVRDRTIELEKDIFLWKANEARWTLFPSSLKMGQYSQDEKILQEYRIKYPQNSHEVFYTYTENGVEYVSEGATNNIFIYEKETLKTPRLRPGILNGIARQNIIRFCQHNKISIVETEIAVSELNNAESIWLSNSVRGFRRIYSYDQKKFEASTPIFDTLWSKLICQ